MIAPKGVLLLGLMMLVACGDREPVLRDVSTGNRTPEEFSIVPNKPLVQPETYGALPAPTPGGTNRTDQTPLLDAVAVLGGNPARIVPGDGIPASDSALVRSATRFGVDGSIRLRLAEEDRDFRKRKSLFSWRIVKDDRYNNAYRTQRLDADRELQRFRRAGALTPSAPPEAK